MGSACDFVQITPIFNFLSSSVLCNQHTSLLLAYWLGICHNFWYWDTIGRLFSIDIPRNYLSHFIIFMFYDKVQHPYFSSFQNCFVLLPARSRLYWLDYEFASKLHQQTEENLLFFFSKQWNSFTHWMYIDNSINWSDIAYSWLLSRENKNVCVVNYVCLHLYLIRECE